jgi:heme/copper-type cytochrome/quinol oxidase subunit 2
MSAKSFTTRGLPILFALAFLAFGLLLATGRLGGSSSPATSPAGSASATMSGSSMGMTTSGATSNGPRAAVVLDYKVVGADEGMVGPDGNKHDTFMTTDLTTIQVGKPVTISIQNMDEMPHSMTAPELGLNIVVPAAKAGKAGTVDFTFTPTRAGTFRWYCAIPCDGDSQGWAMTPSAKGFGQEGFMAGTIHVA